MSADVATPPTSGWQALTSGLASDSATLLSRLIILLIFINIVGLGLHLSMRKPSSVAAPTSGSSRIPPTSASDGIREEPQEGIQMNTSHSDERPSLSTVEVATSSTLSAANTVLLDVASIALNDSS
ncbi:unnamed protein product [Sphagnum jensenii]|uniref:Uncharacterized protein n=1 Tax=Sphagnum jensenii TaxID=128206 RepID=A0ABP0VWL6_9BRYO